MRRRPDLRTSEPLDLVLAAKRTPASAKHREAGEVGGSRIEAVTTSQGQDIAAARSRIADLLPVTGHSWAATNWETVLGWWRDYQPGGALDVIVKDMRSLLDYAAERRVPLPVAALAFQRLHDVWR